MSQTWELIQSFLKKSNKKVDRRKKEIEPVMIVNMERLRTMHSHKRHYCDNNDKRKKSLRKCNYCRLLDIENLFVKMNYINNSKKNKAHVFLQKLNKFLKFKKVLTVLKIQILWVLHFYCAKVVWYISTSLSNNLCINWREQFPWKSCFILTKIVSSLKINSFNFYMLFIFPCFN